jgi:hypothetical protein
MLRLTLIASAAAIGAAFAALFVRSDSALKRLR